MAKYLDENGLLYFWEKIKAAFAAKADAVKNITRSGLTFTATRADGTTFTFDQQDTVYTHPASGVTAGTYGAATKVPKITVDANGHITGVVDTAITGVPPSSHAHGSITNAGAITAAGVALANGDALVFSDASDSNKLKKTSITIGTGTAKYLREDGTWQTPPDTTYGTMGAASASAAGTAGLVPAPAAGKQASFLRGDGTWVVPTNTTYSDATQSTHGLMSTTDKKKLDAFGEASTYALKSDIASMYKYKGSVASTADLPTTGNTTGDVYDVTATGMNYAWTGSAWDALGQIFTITSLTNTEIDEICA